MLNVSFDCFKSLELDMKCCALCPVWTPQEQLADLHLLFAHFSGTGRESSLPVVSSVVASGFNVVVSISIGTVTTTPSATLRQILRNFSISPATFNDYLIKISVRRVRRGQICCKRKSDFKIEAAATFSNLYFYFSGSNIKHFCNWDLFYFYLYWTLCLVYVCPF